MKNITQEEFYEVVTAAFDQLDEHKCARNCEHSYNCLTAAKIYINAVKLYDKMYRKGEGTISTRKVCRCIAKCIDDPQDESLFTGCFQNSRITPKLKDYPEEPKQ